MQDIIIKRSKIARLNIRTNIRIFMKLEYLRNGAENTGKSKRVFITKGILHSNSTSKIKQN